MPFTFHQASKLYWPDFSCWKHEAGLVQSERLTPAYVQGECPDLTLNVQMFVASPFIALQQQLMRRVSRCVSEPIIWTFFVLAQLLWSTVYLSKRVFGQKSNKTKSHGRFYIKHRIISWHRMPLSQTFTWGLLTHQCRWPLSSCAGCQGLAETAWQLGPALHSGKPKAVPGEFRHTLRPPALC